MLKYKISHLKNKPQQKSKTLDSFCKYQSTRFNQATFQQKFHQNHQKLTIPLSQTDLRIQEIKKKYGIPPRNGTNHQRYHSVHEKPSSNKENLEKSKQFLKERSLSSFANHPSVNDLKQSKTDALNNPMKSSRKQVKFQSIKGKENIEVDSYSSCVKQVPENTFKLNYNDTFSKDILRNSTLHEKKFQQASKAELQTVDRNTKRDQVICSRRSNKINKFQKDFWSTAYIPRVQNIDKINVKIKSALQNFQTFEKRDISIPLSKTKVQKIPQYSSILKRSNKKSARQNDLIETRVVQKIPFHQRNASYLTTLYDNAPFATIKTEGNQLAREKRPFHKVYTQQSSQSRFQIVSKQKKNTPNYQDNLFSRIKSLYKKSEQLQQKKAQIMRSHQRNLSYDKMPQKAKYQMSEMRSSSLAFSKMNKLQEIKSKYMNKTSYRSTYTTENQGGEKTENRIITVRKIKSPSRLPFDLIQVKEDKSESYGDEIQDFDKNQDEINELGTSHLEQIIKLTKSGIQTRKKTKEATQVSNSLNKPSQVENKSFCNLMQKQIELDQNFRKAKYWFRYQVKENKLSQLKKQLFNKIQNLRLNLNCPKEEDREIEFKFFTSKSVQTHFQNFEMLDEEIDPFFSLRIFQFTYQSLLSTYLETEKHWIKICKSGLVKQFIESQWIDEIDNDKKKEGNLTDLTRFMSFKLKSFLKNRDLALIFKRITSIDTFHKTTNKSRTQDN